MDYTPSVSPAQRTQLSRRLLLRGGTFQGVSAVAGAAVEQAGPPAGADVVAAPVHELTGLPGAADDDFQKLERMVRRALENWLYDACSIRPVVLVSVVKSPGA
jgi:hypothetical protein